jgi:hypothetical protein
MGIMAKALEALTLEPIFGPCPWSHLSTCQQVHPRGDIPSGSKCCCMACHRTGVEKHAAFRETAAGMLRLKEWQPEGGKDEWSPEADRPEPTRYEGPPKPEPVLTRKQKRDIKYGRNGDAPPDPCSARPPIDDMRRGFLPPMAPDQINRLVDRPA